jgi:hypothetical protein
MGHADDNKADSTRPLSIPPELDDLDSGWDGDAAGVAPLPVVHLGESRPAELGSPAAAPALLDEVTAPAEPPGTQLGGDDSPSAPAVRAKPLALDGLSLELDDPLRRDSALDLADHHTLETPARPPAPVPVAAAPARPPALADTVPPPGEGEANPAATKEMQDRYAAGDFSGALVMAQGILGVAPHDEQAQLCATRCRDVLLKMYTARLGSLDRVARVAVPPEQIRWLSLDHRAGFLLSLVDGASPIEDILDISGMPRLDALRILIALLEQRAISLE